VSDGEARERAASVYDRNAVVVAGAGTGKTTLLVERVLRQMVATGLELDRFAAITFTEKAAAQLRARLAAGLAALA
jgi:ATP-dependent helicase/nuclease subunit A